MWKRWHNFFLMECSNKWQTSNRAQKRFSHTQSNFLSTDIRNRESNRTLHLRSQLKQDTLNRVRIVSNTQKEETHITVSQIYSGILSSDMQTLQHTVNALTDLLYHSPPDRQGEPYLTEFLSMNGISVLLQKFTPDFMMLQQAILYLFVNISLFYIRTIHRLISFI